VSVTGVTGARAQVGADVERHVRELTTITRLPIGVGFGISTPAQAGQVAAYADAVVVGSALSLLIEAHGKSDQLLPAVGGLVGSMKEAMRAARAAQPSAALA
jgi:tryptophan synthase alpha chain